MSQFKVVTAFTDSKNRHVYHQGDVYPFVDVRVDVDRIEELSTKNNKRETIIIEQIETLYNKEETNPVEADTSENIKPNFKQMSKPKLIEYVSDNQIDNVDISMTKKDIIAILVGDL